MVCATPCCKACRRTGSPWGSARPAHWSTCWADSCSSSDWRRGWPTLRDGTIVGEEIWKRFRLDERPTYLQDRLAAIADRARRREAASWRWALTDVSLRAEPGESWALVGANGAGKSTLLKIICRVMYQTAG